MLPIISYISGLFGFVDSGFVLSSSTIIIRDSPPFLFDFVSFILDSVPLCLVITGVKPDGSLWIYCSNEIDACIVCFN